MDSRLDARKEQSAYISYLLRLWQVDAGEAGELPEEKVWRVSIESSLTGERQGFACLDDLFVFLLRQTGTKSGEI